LAIKHERHAGSLYLTDPHFAILINKKKQGTGSIDEIRIKQTLHLRQIHLLRNSYRARDNPMTSLSTNPGETEQLVCSFDLKNR